VFVKYLIFYISIDLISMSGEYLSPQHDVSSGCGWRDGLQLAASTLNKQPWTNDKGWSSNFGVGCEANNPSP
jgi:hypothetical protein